MNGRRGIGVGFRRLPPLFTKGVLVLLIAGCSTTVRKSGQVEKFVIALDSTNLLEQAQSPGGRLPGSSTRTNLVGSWGDRIRYSTDVVSIQVHSIFLDDVPGTLTGSHDIVVFAEIWENAAADNETPLTKVVYNGRNQMVPGRLNFDGNLAYGPTLFKGHPIKIRFTIMVLQKQRGTSASAVPDVISKYTAAIPVYGVFVSQAAGIIRDVLRAQPDVIAFDYETTMLSENPEKLQATIPTGPAPAKTTSERPKDRESTSTGPVGTTSIPSADQGFDDRFGWLQYGFYAIVETAPRTNSLIALSRGTPKEPAPGQTATPASNPLKPFDASKRYYYDRGWVAEYDPFVGLKSAPATNRLGSKYIVFSITPKQLSESDATLISASQASSATLQSLRQSQDNVNAMLDTVNRGADLMGHAIIKAKADGIADQLAKQKGITPEQFNKQFESEWKSLTSGLGTYWNSSGKADELKGIQQGVTSRYQQVFNSLGITNTSPPNEQITRALDFMTNSLQAASQAEQFKAQSSTNHDELNRLHNEVTANYLIVAQALSSARQLLSEVQTNYAAMKDVNNTNYPTLLIARHTALTNALGKLGQLMARYPNEPTNNVATVIQLASDCVRFAGLAQGAASNAVYTANQATNLLNKAQSSAAEALRLADSPAKISNATALIGSIAEAYQKIASAAASAAKAAEASTGAKEQSDDGMALASALISVSVKYEKTVGTLKDKHSEAIEIENAAKQLNVYR